jgi:hypothetical protein
MDTDDTPSASAESSGPAADQATTKPTTSNSSDDQFSRVTGSKKPAPQDPTCAPPPASPSPHPGAGAPETTPPTTTAATHPGDVLNLRNWYLTLPTGAAGDPDTVHQPDLATYSSRYFALNDTRDGVMFTAPVDGVTTKNSHYPRSELREMNGAEEAAWSNTSGVHTLTVSEAITHLPDAKPEAVAAQIHDGNDDVLQIRLEGARLLAQYNDGATQVELDPHYTLGTRYTLTLTAADRRVQLRYNDTQKVDLPLTGTGWYFKAGAYVQSNTSTGDQPPAHAQVVIYALTATHTDQPTEASTPALRRDRLGGLVREYLHVA